MSVLVDLVVIAALFALAFAMTFEGARTWLLERAHTFADRYGRPEHTAEWELEHAELWLMARRKRLGEDLRRIELLIRHDEHLSATRQLGNRMARDQLIASLARIPDVFPGRDRFFADESVEATRRTYETAAPSPALAARPATVEVLDVAGWR